MTTPEIIGSIRSTYTRVVCMVCEEKGIEYVLTERPLRAPEILAIHPFGKMPLLRHGMSAIFPSSLFMYSSSDQSLSDCEDGSSIFCASAPTAPAGVTVPGLWTTLPT